MLLRIPRDLETSLQRRMDAQGVAHDALLAPCILDSCFPDRSRGIHTHVLRGIEGIVFFVVFTKAVLREQHRCFDFGIGRV